MPNAILAGVPANLTKQVKAALKRLNSVNWNFQIVESRDRRIAAITANDIETVRKMACKSGGAHVIAFDDNRNRLVKANLIRPYFRFRWGDMTALRAVAGELQPFIDSVASVLLEEDAWRNVMPKDKASPLVLPSRIFDVRKDVADIWSMSEAFNKEAKYFPRLEATLARFCKEHLKQYASDQPRYFVDGSHRVWKDSGPYHGVAPFPRYWKYSFRLNEKFHFDVEHEQGREFAFTDALDQRHNVKATCHANIDTHGHVR